MIEIKLGSKQSIGLAIAIFIKNSEEVMKREPIDKEELIMNIDYIIHHEEAQRLWLERWLEKQ